jgi:hypothetical protein
MRTLRPSVAWVSRAVLALVALAPTVGAQQSDPYGPTIQFGTGLINIPVAWVSPRSADAWMTASGRALPSAEGQNFATKLNTNISIETHFLGRFSVGASAYDQNTDYGFFGQLLVARDNQFGFLPALAVGVRNLGNCKYEDRMLIGCDTHLVAGKYERGLASSTYQNFNTNPTVYGVATKDVSLGGTGRRLPPSTLGFTVGYGNGIFSDDGGLGENYNRRGQIAKGLFLGGRFVAHPSLNGTLSVLAENDGWDYNAGVVYDYRGISLGVYGTELEEGGHKKPSAVNGTVPGFNVYNYAKANITLGYSGNIVDIARGVILRTRITSLTREQQRLRLEIAERQRRIEGLELALRKAQASELAGIEARRRQIEADVQAERDAIQRATDRLREIEGGRTTPPPTTPPSTPPTTPPTTPPAGSSPPAV